MTPEEWDEMSGDDCTAGTPRPAHRARVRISISFRCVRYKMRCMGVIRKVNGRGYRELNSPVDIWPPRLIWYVHQRTDRGASWA